MSLQSSRNLYFLLSFITGILMSQKTAAQNSYWQQRVNYTIEVSLNDVQHTLDGFMKLEYTNNSPDTLSYIWFHIWPNAFKNDRTAFSEQLLTNGNTQFYFSKPEEKGYINRLDFRTGQTPLKTEDHPEHQDILKLILPQPLPPNSTIQIQTPFHVQIPKNFSRGGHIGQSYQITQWYPKPAVYDANGWHPMPYLDQGEFYSEFGSYHVKITLPENYVVAATGILQEEKEWNWLKSRKKYIQPENTASKKIAGKSTKQPVINDAVPSSKKTKTINYWQDNIHDFAWFADKNFIVNTDTIQLNKNQPINIFSFYTKENAGIWKNSTKMIKDAIRFRSTQLGNYPYTVVSAVDAPLFAGGGMEYPTITSIGKMQDESELEYTIEHEVGHNWFYGMLASNEREYPWLDEGLNTYFDRRYEKYKKKNLLGQRENQLIQKALHTQYTTQKDQPIATTSENFSSLNYSLTAYIKTADWLEALEKKIGTTAMEEALKKYFQEWKFKHPQPKDFLQVFSSLADTTQLLKELKSKGSVDIKQDGAMQHIPKIQWQPFQHPLDPHQTAVIPFPAYNLYDGFQLGAAFHNYDLPPKKLQFVLAPIFGFKSKSLNGMGKLSYTSRASSQIEKIEWSVSGMKFSGNSGKDSSAQYITAPFFKITPAVKITFLQKDPRSQKESWLEWKSYWFQERGFNYQMKSTDSMYYPLTGKYKGRYLNQLTYVYADHRALYPYQLQWQLQQGKDFYKTSITANYFLNYATGGGAQVRFFAAKFGYMGKSSVFDTYVYQPKLTAVRGNEDYTYDNFFLGRSASEGLASQQIQMRDGGLKIRTDLFQNLQGRSENWITSLNINSTLPPQWIPAKIPLRIFLDIGTYAEAWQKNATTSKFLYVSGLHLALLKECIQIYLPILYSNDFSNSLKTVPEENKWTRKISFTIDLQKLNLRTLSNNRISL